MLLLFSSAFGSAPQVGVANLSLSASELWPPLNADGPADAVHWTEEELFEYMDEAVKRLARVAGPFVVRDTSLTSVTGTAAYTLPTGHIHTLQLDLAGTTLKARTTQELEALDSDWQDTQDTPKSFVLDSNGLTKLLLYPKPSAGSQTIGLVMSEIPAEITASSAFLAAPPVIREYFTFSALAAAREKESKGSMDEVVAWLRGITQQYEQAAVGIWGAA